MAQRQQNVRQLNQRVDFSQGQEFNFYPGLRQPAQKKALPLRTFIIYSFAGLCFFIFASSGAGLFLKTTGIIQDDKPAPTGIPTQISVTPPKLALILPEQDMAKCVPERIDQEQGRVTAVLAADMIEVEFADGSLHQVRYIGMAPDRDAFKNERAKGVNQQLVDGQTVVLVRDVTDKDLFGRLLRYVFVGDIFVNYEIVAQGWANLDTYPPDVACADNFRLAQQQAAAAGRGIWAESAH